jgi:hypothetical protein
MLFDAISHIHITEQTLLSQGKNASNFHSGKTAMWKWLPSPAYLRAGWQDAAHTDG